MKRIHCWKNFIELSLGQLERWKELAEENKQQFVDYQKEQLGYVVKIQDDVKQLVEESDATAEEIHVLNKRLTDIEISLNLFTKIFIVFNPSLSFKELVTVSTSLNKKTRSTKQSNVSPSSLTQSPSENTPEIQSNRRNLVSSTFAPGTFEAYTPSAPPALFASVSNAPF
ncbi:unnamed protein product [Adineta ricciae]|uniref:Uncharacterized protein n=1 Tax=Adineta ricciae TaxID=249248 RepID=A0A814Y669_ADIRI|nr:unnamed protein product [Adineta ricciae]CAF1224963.1 unnamed protein product [Adineta ricciae]